MRGARNADSHRLIAPDGLLLRGIRWRLGLSVLTVLTTMIAVAAAVLGPLYQHAAGDSVLRQTVAAAPVQSSGQTLSPYHDESDPLAQAARAQHVLQRLPGAHALYGAPIVTVDGGISFPVAGQATKSELLARTGICGALHFVSGGCHLGQGDVIMTAAGAHQVDRTVGDPIDVSVNGGGTLHLTIVGIVATPDLSLPYWWGAGTSDFPLGQGGAAGAGGPPPTDPLIASPATVLSVGAHDSPDAVVQLPLRPGGVDLASEAVVKRTLAAATRAELALGFHSTTNLPTLLGVADHSRHVMATIVAIAATQLVLLSVWVLASLLVRSSDARRSEARVARLRGFTGRSMLWVTAAEPGLLCLAGALLGVALAYVAILVARSELFVASASIAFDGWAAAALGLTLLVIVGALVIGAVRLLRSADLATSASGRPRSASAASLVVDCILVVLAVVALVALGTSGALGGRSDPIASAAPGLLALGAAVVAVQLILFTCRLGVSLSDGSSAVGPFLALRQTVRRPGVLRQARVLVVALCLACFASAAWAVAHANRQRTAEFEVGASAVVDVRGDSAPGLQRAVDRADPHGRWAMAAVQVDTSSTALVAVDASRLVAVTSWPKGISRDPLRRVARAIDPPSHPAVMLPGGPVSVTAAASGLSSARLHDLELELWVFNARGGSTITPLQRLRPGQATYHGSLAAICDGGCRLAGLGVLPAPGAQAPASGAVTVAVHGFADGGSHPVPADLVPGGWRSTTAGADVVAGQGPGLTVRFSAQAIATNTGGTGNLVDPMVSVNDRPAVLPAVITTELAQINAGAQGPLITDGLDANSVNMHPVVTASALPRVGQDAAFVDLDSLANEQLNPTSPDAAYQVWLGPHAPHDALARLRAAGLRPTSVARASTVLSTLQRTGPALADDFLLVATLAALLVAAASTLGALGATTRARATELTSLRVAGTPQSALTRALMLETGILLLTALCGVGAGVLAAALAVPSLPELTTRTLAPYQYGLPAGVITIVAVVVLALVALAAGAVTAVLLRRMSPMLLRTAPDDVSG